MDDPKLEYLDLKCSNLKLLTLQNKLKQKKAKVTFKLLYLMQKNKIQILLIDNSIKIIESIKKVFMEKIIEKLY